jgi:hypothetical protein
MRVRIADRIGDTTFMKVKDTFIGLVTDHGFASKDEVMREAGAFGFRDSFPWVSLITVIRRQQPQVLVLSLSRLIFYGPRALARQGVTPNQYTSRTYKAAYGFASVAQFVQLGELHRQIAEVKYKQQEITAARAMQRVEHFRDVLAMPVDLLDYIPLAASPGGESP